MKALYIQASNQQEKQRERKKTSSEMALPNTHMQASFVKAQNLTILFPFIQIIPCNVSKSLFYSTYIFACLRSKLTCFGQSLSRSVSCCYRFIFCGVEPFIIHLLYFISVSLLGFLLLRIPSPDGGQKNIDLFFMSVSAATVSSMSTIQMEDLSKIQLSVLAFLMLIGGEVFTSLLDLQMMKAKLDREENKSSSDGESQVELGPIKLPSMDLKSRSIMHMCNVILAYLLLIHTIGSISILVCLSVVSSVRGMLKKKGACESLFFSVFVTISSFANGGFIPLNENMAAFKNNSGLLLLIVPQILAGNVFFPPFLRLAIWASKRALGREEESDYLLENSSEVGFHHLLSKHRSTLLAVTTGGLIVVLVIIFCWMEWDSEVLSRMDPYQKIVGGLFQSVNLRHAGESIVDISVLPAALLVLFVFVMFLPPYTTFIPIQYQDRSSCGGLSDQRGNEKHQVLQNLIFSQITYLTIFVMLICITEREKITQDPLNFNVLNIVIEVVSAYGNIGFSTGYSCERQLRPDATCMDKWYGFVGKWSNKGKLILIVIMFFGRLKKFSMSGGKAWKLAS
ncbi:putative cation transporter HKT6 [Acorus calamus]|uniref:Cation transporter HKT6 n=1 Tax=Acorus calamus TaxID=4465 RepID=A0AAV9EW58_ACOCL|nr:putative cation transporter HKT6 [Acorus calamus]